MRRSIFLLLLISNCLVQWVLCEKLVKISQHPTNVLQDFHAYGEISIVHFNVPICTAVAEFKFTVKEEKTGGIGNCSPRDVSVFVKSGSLPLVNPDGSKVGAKLMRGRRQYLNLSMESSGDSNIIRIIAPPPGDWYAIAFRAWKDPDADKIKQQGLGASCDTVLEAELSVEKSSRTVLMDNNSKYLAPLNNTDRSFVLQLLLSKDHEHREFTVKSSCEDCKLSVHITAQDNLASEIINSTQDTIIPFKPYADTFHYVILRLISGEATNVTIQLLDPPKQQKSDGDNVVVTNLFRRVLPEFFTVDFDYLPGNETEPPPINLTTNSLTVLRFEINRIYDVGGSITVGLKLADGEEKKNIIVIACTSLGYHSNISKTGSCIRATNTTLPDVYVNSTDPTYVHIPYPEPGTWHISLRAFNIEKDCECVEKCLNETVCENCSCMNATFGRVEAIVASWPCIEGQCNSWGKCVHYMSGGIVFSACHCNGGYRGFDCADDTYVLNKAAIIVRLFLLTFSNIAFIASIYVAFRRKYYTEAIVYAAVMFFSTFYHACEAGEDLYGVCIMKLSVLQFCDFFNALLSIWVTLVAMASFGPRLTAFCQIAGAVILAMGAEMDRTALWVFLLPAITGTTLIGLSWGMTCRSRRTLNYPSHPYRNIRLPAGLFLVFLGLICYAFLQTRRNYYIIHSLWHVCVAIGVVLLLPKRQYMK